MFKRSTMLKVVSIIALVLATIATLTNAAALVTDPAKETLRLLDMTKDQYMLSSGVSLAVALIDIVGGICGLTLKNKKPLFAIGAVMVIARLVNNAVSLSITGTDDPSFMIGFFGGLLIGLVIPVLYLVGVSKCNENGSATLPDYNGQY